MYVYVIVYHAAKERLCDSENTPRTSSRRNLLMTTKRKGFTLMELLILFVIIGALSGLMALMNKNAVSSAQANHIIHDFRNLKTAAMLWHNDNPKAAAHDRKAILKYLNSKSMVEVTDTPAKNGGYILKVSDSGKSWYIGREISNDSGIRSKLTAKATSSKLLGSDMKSLYNNDSQVWVQLLEIGG